MKKIKHYQISCQGYGPDVNKLDGTYVVIVKLDFVVDKTFNKVNTVEDGLSMINDLIKDYKFEQYPDLTIYDSKILGKMIVAEY
jgi:hypothetical protein